MGSKGAGIVRVVEIDKSIMQILDQLVNGEATPKEQEIRNREHRGASKKLKDVEHRAEQKSIDLDLVDVDGAAGLVRIWKQAQGPVTARRTSNYFVSLSQNVAEGTHFYLVGLHDCIC